MSRTSTRRTLVGGGSFLLGLALNAALLALIARFDTPVRLDAAAPAPAVVPIDLSQFVLPPRAKPLHLHTPLQPQPAVRPRGRKAPQGLTPNPAPNLSASSASAMAPVVPPEPAGSAPFASDAPDAATRAKVSAALRGLTGCSMVSGPDDETTRERCRSAFTRADMAGVAIETLPDEKRVGYDRVAAKAEDRRNAVTDIPLPKAGGAGGMGRDKGRNINIHYGCWMKVGPSATPKLHCPGVM